jgi:hypothetical protein
VDVQSFCCAASLLAYIACIASLHCSMTSGTLLHSAIYASHRDFYANGCLSFFLTLVPLQQGKKSLNPKE